jgi:hypothetical protein
MMTQIDSYLAGELFLTQTQAYPYQGSFRSPLVQLRNKLRGPNQRHTLRNATLPGQSSLACSWTHANSSPHILTSSRVHTFYLLTSGLSWATRLCGQNDLSSQLNVRHAFNMTRGHTMNQSLIDRDGDRSTPKTSLSCCFTIDIPLGLHSYY